MYINIYARQKHITEIPEADSVSRQINLRFNTLARIDNGLLIQLAHLLTEKLIFQNNNKYEIKVNRSNYNNLCLYNIIF